MTNTLNTSASRILRIGDFGSFRSGGTPAKKNASYWGGDIPFVTAADLRYITVDSSNARSFLTLDGFESGKTAVVQIGCVLLGTRTGVGRVSVALEKMAASQDITVITCADFVNPYYLARLLAARASELVAAASGSTIQGIRRNFLQSIEVELPSLDEQRRIVAQLESQLAAAERARHAAQTQLDALDAMSAALLRNNFPRSPESR